MSFEEVVDAIEALRNRKATLIDGINAEFWKCGERLLHLWNCGEHGKIPENWLNAKVVPLFKIDARNIRENYRGTSLSDSVYKVYYWIMNNRFRVIVENIIGEEHIGSRKRCV